MRDFNSLLQHSPTWEVVAVARAGTMVFVFMLLCQQMPSVLQRSRAKVTQSLLLLLLIWSDLIHKNTLQAQEQPLWQVFQVRGTWYEWMGCQWTGMLKEQISGLLGDKILDQSFQNGNFSPKPNLQQEYLTSTQRSPLRESHVTTISRHYKFPQKVQLLQIKLICLVEH